MHKINKYLLRNSKMILFGFFTIGIIFFSNVESFNYYWEEIDERFNTEMEISSEGPISPRRFAENELLTQSAQQKLLRAKIGYYFFWILELIFIPLLLGTIYILCKSIGEYKGDLTILIILGIASFFSYLIVHIGVIIDHHYPYSIEWDPGSVMYYIENIAIALIGLNMLFLLYVICRRLIFGRDKPEIIKT